MRKSFQKNKSKLEQEAKRKKRNVQLMSLFLGFILISSLFGYALLQNNNQNAPQIVTEYDTEFRIVSVEGQRVWQAEFRDAQPYFFALPSQVEGYFAEDEALIAFSQAQSLALTFDPLALDQQLSQVVISQFGDVAQDKVVTLGITQELAAYQNLTQVTCDDATSLNPVVYLGLTNQSNQTGILLRDDCITVQGVSPQDLFFLTEKLRYVHHGIDFTTPTLS